MSSNFLGLPAENSSLRMTVFPVSFKIAITHPYRYSEFISESSPFEKRLQPNFPAKKKKTSIITVIQYYYSILTAQRSHYSKEVVFTQ